MSFDIAIVGLSCRFPKAPDKAGFWSLLSEGRSTVQRLTPNVAAGGGGAELLDLLAPLLADDLEHVVGAPAADEAPVCLANVFVAGAGPGALEGAARLLALVPVAVGGGGAVDEQFADLAGGSLRALLVDEPQLVAAGRQHDLRCLARADDLAAGQNLHGDW